ncbi:hypothetical protein MC7420_2353 [Coleofasciculus chthonoplastes PCC 7420]|uniref:Uncharacterized protein n=1 Tax=Coleofasciculus chthonoplastes PCC 7420 TaxID=118168 RepID=B4W273_9CYAN|nr:hypothetical protein MC7420_2353 [Coleofasciculus chthonoplastes PCC 7420]
MGKPILFSANCIQAHIGTLRQITNDKTHPPIIEENQEQSSPNECNK